MPLYIWHTGKSFTISLDYKEAPIWSQIIIWCQKRFEQIMEDYWDNPNTIVKEYPAICEWVRQRTLKRINSLIDPDDWHDGCMTDISWINIE